MNDSARSPLHSNKLKLVTGSVVLSAKTKLLLVVFSCIRQSWILSPEKVMIWKGNNVDQE